MSNMLRNVLAVQLTVLLMSIDKSGKFYPDHGEYVLSIHKKICAAEIEEKKF